MFCKKTLVFAVCVSLLAVSALRAQQPVAVKQVRGNLYQVSGGVGNAFFYVGPDEVLVVDARVNADAAREMLAEIKKITDKPVRRVILTHSDGDHVGGLGGFPQPLTIIAHANARQEMVKASSAGNAKLPLPNETFSKELTLFVGGTEVQLLYFGPAHTSGDIVVYIPAEKTAIVGDLVFVGRDPLIHTNKQGSSSGLVAVLRSLVRLDADLFLSGHADGIDKNAVRALTTQIAERQAEIRKLVKEGKTLAEVKKELGIADQGATPGGRRWPSLVEIIYQEVAAEPNDVGFVSIFDGQTLNGWHIESRTGHSKKSGNKSGGRWVVEQGAIVGSQDIPANGGLLMTDQQYGDFEVALEMNNDFGPDSGLFLRSDEKGTAYQALIDYHKGGNLMGLYGEAGLRANPSVVNFSFLDSPEKIRVVTASKTGPVPVAFPMPVEEWPKFWRHGQWNELRARIVGNPPHITTWIKGVKFMDWTETEKRHPDTGMIGLQVHAGGDSTKEFVRYRNIRVKLLSDAK